MPSQLETPVVFMIFNRPEPASRVFAEIARARPKRLLVIADGPRPHVRGERKKCEDTRRIIEKVDWDCEVSTQFSDQNLGCRVRVSSGLNWVFSQVEEAIILEDDCVPDPSFFVFCEEMLKLYCADSRVMFVGGSQFDPSKESLCESYHFARIPIVWGWATWRRAWRYYDVNMELWPEFRRLGFVKRALSSGSGYWSSRLQRTYEGKIDTWDYQWLFAIWSQGGLCIHPKRNLISNIGFNLEATHTKVKSPFAELPCSSLAFPLMHPRIMLPDLTADDRFTAVSRNLGLRVSQKIMRTFLEFRRRSE